MKNVFFFYKKFYSIVILLILLIFFSYAWSEPITISLGEGINIDEILLKFKSVIISELYESGIYKFGEPVIYEAEEKYKFVIIKAEGKNIGKRRSALATISSNDQIFEIEVDKGYFYSPYLWFKSLGLNLLPEESGEDELVFKILKTKKPINLHCYIKGKRFIVSLNESKFIYLKSAKLSIEDYKISYEYKKAFILNSQLIDPEGFEIYYINPVIKNFGDKPIEVNFEVEIKGFKEVGVRGPYIIPSNSTVTLEASAVIKQHWQGITLGRYPRIPEGKYDLKIMVKDESGKVITERLFSIEIKE